VQGGVQVTMYYSSLDWLQHDAVVLQHVAHVDRDVILHNWML